MTIVDDVTSSYVIGLGPVGERAQVVDHLHCIRPAQALQLADEVSYGHLGQFKRLIIVVSTAPVCVVVVVVVVGAVIVVVVVAVVVVAVVVVVFVVVVVIIVVVVVNIVATKNLEYSVCFAGVGVVGVGGVE